jgi:hypothetical protein
MQLHERDGEVEKRGWPRGGAETAKRRSRVRLLRSEGRGAGYPQISEISRIGIQSMEEEWSSVRGGAKVVEKWRFENPVVAVPKSGPPHGAIWSFIR